MDVNNQFLPKSAKISVGSMIFLIGALAALLLVALRAWHVFSFSAPLHVVTSGFEEESLFALWKFHHGWPIYHDPYAIPYTASYFNWFFYNAYGVFVSTFLSLFNLSEAWIPTLGRLLTLLIVTLGFAVTYVLLTYSRARFLSSTYKITAFSLAVLLWFGPLVGYWAMTVRPDLLGLLFDTFAAAFILLFINKRPRWAIVGAALACYLSWSCKQINIVMPLAIGFYLLFQRKWGLWALFSCLLVLGYSLTLFIATESMLNSLFFIKTAIPLSSAVWVNNLTLFVKKSSPVWILLDLIILTSVLDKRKRTLILRHPAVQLGGWGLLAWALTLLPASSKVGSADNYHFIALLFLTFIVGGGLSILLKHQRIWHEITLGLSGVVFLIAVSVAALNGSMQALTAQHVQHLALQKCMACLPKPIFILNHYAALPWINPSSHSFVIAHNYWFDRAQGLPFEQGGIGGLIQQGYFKTLLLPHAILQAGNLDGASLSEYQRTGQWCDEFQVLLHKEIR